MVVLTQADIELIEDCDRKEEEWRWSIQNKDHKESRLALQAWLAALHKRRQTAYRLPSRPISASAYR